MGLSTKFKEIMLRKIFKRKSEMERQFRLAEHYFANLGEGKVKLPRANKPKFKKLLQSKHGKKNASEITTTVSFYKIEGKIYTLLPHDRFARSDEEDHSLAAEGGSAKAKFVMDEFGDIFILGSAVFSS